MRVSIHQPSYFPWLGLLEKISRSDLFILMDEVQLNDKSYQHRNIFLTNSGQIKYLTIPLDKKGYLSKKISELQISSSGWQLVHKNFITENYRKHPYFKLTMDQIEFIFHKEYKFALDCIFDSMITLTRLFEINTKVIKQSALNYDHTLHKGALVIDLLKQVNATEYVSGEGLMGYADLREFEDNSIKVDILKYDRLIYNQRSSPTFISGLSSLDFLFNEGLDHAKSLFKSMD